MAISFFNNDDLCILHTFLQLGCGFIIEYFKLASFGRLVLLVKLEAG